MVVIAEARAGGHSAAFDANQRVLLIRLGKVLSETELRRAHETVIAVLETCGLCSCIMDFSKVETLELDEALLADIARSPRIVPSGAFRVLVAPTPSIYAVMRRYALMQNDSSGEFFLVRSLDEARMLFQSPFRFQPL